MPDKADVKRCSVCRGAHAGMEGELEKAGNGWWLVHPCPATDGRTTKSRVAAPSRTTTKPKPKAKPKPKPKPEPKPAAAAAKPKPEPKPKPKPEPKPKPKPKPAATSPSGESMPKPAANKPQSVTIKMDAVALYDLDDSELWPVAVGLIHGLEKEGVPLSEEAKLIREAREARLRYERGEGEHGDAKTTKRDTLETLGEQLAHVLVLLMLSEGIAWESIRPPVLDGRSTVERLSDFTVGTIGAAAGVLLPDAIDPTLPNQVGGPQGPSNAELAEQGIQLGLGLLSAAGIGG